MADQIKTNTAGEVSSPATEVKAEAPKRKEPIFAAPQSKKESAASAAKGGAASQSASGNANGGNSGAEKKKRPLPVFADEVKANGNDNQEPKEPGDEEIGAFAAPITVDASELVNEQPMEEETPMGVAAPSEVEYPDPVSEDNTVQGLYGPITLKNDKYDDPGRLEAEVLMAEAKADKIARKERKANKGNKARVVPVVMPVDFPDFDDDDFTYDNNESDAADSDAYADDLGRARAETMLADHKTEVARKKAMKDEKRNQRVAPETVVEDKEYDVSEPEYDEPDVAEEASAAPLTTAAAKNTADKSYEDELEEMPVVNREPIFEDEAPRAKEKKAASFDDGDEYAENTAIAVMEIEELEGTNPQEDDEEARTDEPSNDEPSGAEPSTDEPSTKSSGDDFFADNFSTDEYDDYLYEKDRKARKSKGLPEHRIAYNEVNYFNDDDPMGEYPMDKNDKKQERIAAKLRAEYIAEAEAQAEANNWWGARAEEKPHAEVSESPRTIFVPVGIPVGDKKLSDIIAENYPDYNGEFDEAAYYAESKAKEEAKAKAKAEEKAEKAVTKAEKAEAKTAKITKKYDAATESDNLKADQKAELLTHGKADIKEQSARKAEEKAEAKAERLAKKNYVAPIPTYEDHTENFDKAAYDAEKQAISDAEAKVKADAKAAKAEKKAAKAEAKTEKSAKKYDSAINSDNLKADQKAELLTHGKADIKEQSARKAEEKAEAKAERLAKKNYVAPIPTYEDHTESFDKAAYDAEKQAIADADAKVKADAKAAKAEKKAASEAKAENKIASSYDKATGEQLEKMERKAEMLSTNKQAAAEKKELKAKSETKAGQLTGAAAAATAAILGDTSTTIFGDFTESFDRAAYDAEKQAAAEAVAKAKADTKAAAAKAKAEKKAESAAKTEAKISNAYDKATGEQLEKMERKAEMLSTNKQAAADKKELKAKSETKAGQLTGTAAAATAAILGDTSTTIFGDFTESFDRAAYDAEKQAAAEAAAKAKADTKAAAAKAKAERQAESAAKTEAKIASSYDKATGEQLARMERKAELVSTNTQAVAENKALKVEAKAAKAEAKAGRQAAKIAAASTVPPTAIFADYLESFDRAAYDAEKQAIAAAEAKAKADAKALKFERKAASEAKVEAEIAAAYDKATGKQLAKMERQAELVSANSQAAADKTARAEAKAEAKAELTAPKLATAAATIPAAAIFGDFTESFDRAAYDAEKQATADAEAKVKAEAVAVKAERKHASEAKAEAKIATAYDRATGEQVARMERKSDLVSANKQAIADRKTIKDNARNEKQAARLAQQSEIAPVTPFDDFTESFNKTEYDREKTASAEALAAKEKADAISKQLSRVAAKNQKDIKATEMLETKLSDGEMLDFAKTYRSDVKRNKKQLERSEKYGKFMLEYGSTYDPEWDGEFNNYGLAENDPLTEGVKLSTSRRRSPKREKLSAFNVTKLTALARMQRDTDNQMVVARVQSEFADLELEVAKAQQDFAGDFRNSKEKRWLRNSRKKLGSLRSKIVLAEKYEKLDNDRYYSVVTTNFDTVALPSRADRDELIAMREELMRLLDIRDEINAELIQLYTGTAKNGGVNHIKRRNKVVLKARKRAHKKYRKHYNALNKYHVTRNEKMRVCDKLDEIVELSGELARIKYILKKENPIGKARREYIREKGNAKSNLRYAKRYAERFTVKAVRRAKIRKRRTRALVASLVLIGLLGAGALALYILGPHLLEMLKPMIPEQFHQYIDMILGAWPKK